MGFVWGVFRALLRGLLKGPTLFWTKRARSLGTRFYPKAPGGSCASSGRIRTAETPLSRFGAACPTNVVRRAWIVHQTAVVLMRSGAYRFVARHQGVSHHSSQGTDAAPLTYYS